jgi:hypothetical protein
MCPAGGLESRVRPYHSKRSSMMILDQKPSAARPHSDLRSVLGAILVVAIGAAMVVGISAVWQASRGPDQPAQASLRNEAATGEEPDAAGEEGARSGGVVGPGLTGDHQHGEPQSLTPREQRQVDAQLDRAREASARYRDIRVARADGYFQVTQFLPGFGMHLASLSVPTSTFDPTRPKVLLYEPDGSGGYRLAGVAYAIDRVSDVPPDGFAGGSDVWHYHRNLCFIPNGTVTIAFSQGACARLGGLYQAETDWLLHAWIWEPNPRGVFVEINPSVTWAF